MKHRNDSSDSHDHSMNTVSDTNTQKTYVGELEFTPSDRKRFEAKIQKSEDPDGCWVWTSAFNRQRYGLFEMRTTTMRAHRVSFELANGPIQNGLFVCHRCDNPACVNPAHLFLGNQFDNMRDASKKGRMPIGATNIRSKLNPHAVSNIRKLLAEGVSQAKVGAMFGVDQTAISSIHCGRTWRHVQLT